jgi:signal transduction histidine kinase
MKSLLQRSRLLPKPVVTVLAVMLVALLAVVDYVTGWEFQINALYLIPVAGGCWLVGRKTGLILAVIAAVAWLIVDLMTGYPYKNPAIPYWNALILLTLFLAVVRLLAAFQTVHYHLDETVQQRTAALQAEIAERKRLEAAKLQAERLAVIGTMGARVAHEVLNPLGSITLNLDLIEKQIEHLADNRAQPPTEAHVLVQEMRHEAQRIHRIIEGYLQFARLPKAQLRPLNVKEWFDETLAVLHSTFAESNVALQTEFDPTLTTIFADAGQLGRAVLNLIQNSIDAMPQGGTLTIATQRLTDQAVVRIADTGHGIAAEAVQQMFVPFLTTKAQGTGLGLAFAQHIVTEHGGHIECESIMGQGSTFTIFLPLKEVA